MILTTNRQSFLAAGAFIVVAALVVLDPLPEPQLTIIKSIFFWPAVLWLGWFAWTRRAGLKTGANAGGLVRPLLIVAAIAAILALARWAALSTGLAQ